MKMFRNNLLLSSQHCSYYDGASLLLNDIGNGFYSLYGDKFENKVKLDSPFRNHDSAHILGFGSINGLYFVIENGNYNRLILWNPATPAAVKVIPSSMVFESLDLSDDDFGMFYTSNYLNGFGYDDITDDYKVIQYVSVTGELVGIRDMSVEVLGYESLCSFWEIYSLRSNTWRKLEAEMPPSLDSFEGSQVYMDGVCHWFCGQDSPDGQCVVSFYLNSEEFFITPIPSDDDYFVERPIGVGTKGEIFFVRKDEELLWLDIGSQMIVELGYKVDPYSSRITIYKESILPLEGIRDLFFVY
jgi:F-box interacting protein